MSNWYALVNPDNGIDMESNSISPDVSTKPGWRWLSIVDELPTPHDPLLQICEGPFKRIEIDKVVKYWTIRDKTAYEINQEKDQKLADVERPTLIMSLDQENRIRALEAAASGQTFTPLTMDEYKEYVKGLL